jgi:hypothetical protein
VTEKIVEGFREGYAEDVTKKENPEKWLKLRVTKVATVYIQKFLPLAKPIRR